ncbi:Ff.00g134950.m01.CDS01 [Fusarium sp. VM40]|nr:Ff.00g134950.m01.CDS01 [Fusarium sp. VM40]
MGTHIIVLTWITPAFAGNTKAGVGLSIFITVTHAVHIAAFNIYPKPDAPYYLRGNAISSSFVFLTGLSAFSMSAMLYRENRRRDRRFARPEEGVPIDMGGDPDKA